MIIIKSFDDNSIYENVLPTAVFFDEPQYVDTDTAADVRNCLHSKSCPYVNIPELRKVFNHGKTHADMTTMPKVRLSSIYGEVHSKA